MAIFSAIETEEMIPTLEIPCDISLAVKSLANGIVRFVMVRSVIFTVLRPDAPAPVVVKIRLPLMEFFKRGF